MTAFKLSSIEREKRPEAFEIELTDGSMVTLADPKRMHFTVLAGMDALPPTEQVKALVGSGWDKFAADPEMDGEALEAVMGAWKTHYGMPDSPGEARSSSGS